MKKALVYLIFVFAVVTIGALIGMNNVPGEWYQTLNKPFFNPPNWIFGPVWTALYVMIAIAGARTWLQSRMGGRMQLWGSQMLLNFLWSPIFFTMQSPTGALILIVPMLICVIAFIIMTSTRDRISMWLFVPYAVWVAFATLLNASIVYLN
ncbi:TspO/MBR family protein [Agrobacterium rosae]|uniref:Sensor histidine kinase n=1 Tax=Agrobacterium rosae TaxID=1972867 RepID=A0AAE5VRK0_9HYPH|nr:TspO/MBR family protein [Agrobacterium rosae]KAA3510941.1 tryptophan-rich sensory protein [Agrobacterium rosae]KAA3517979.1 tryptophan-rich sensory protein [Agrobacterium rosae]MCM2434257.1 tryptophan-rich sensory protein [Agrobacterium rosae]MDX8303725.1 TspO/MBR family protein [Agrobacterium rosae]MDX8329476.1 TspO/MBR family protein [Agrobacterium rosae]